MAPAEVVAVGEGVGVPVQRVAAEEKSMPSPVGEVWWMRPSGWRSAGSRVMPTSSRHSRAAVARIDSPPSM
ncbi:MAG: hypothetical protein U0841_10695 [Chloroflexia bacterium]